jgi:hypothetical protein
MVLRMARLSEWGDLHLVHCLLFEECYGLIGLSLGKIALNWDCLPILLFGSRTCCHRRTCERCDISSTGISPDATAARGIWTQYAQPP